MNIEYDFYFLVLYVVREGDAMKRRLPVVALIMVLLTALTGCMERGGDYYSKLKKKTSEEQAKEKNVLTVWCWDENFNVYAMKKAAEYYKKEVENVTIDIETMTEEILSEVANSGDVEKLPDILLMQDNSFQKNVLSYPDFFVDITDSGIDFSEFASGKTAYSVVNGKNYGVPFDNGAVVACYRTDILKQAGFQISDLTDITWQQFQEIGQVVLEKTGHTLVSTEAGESDLIMMMLQSAGGSLFDEEGNPVIADNLILQNVIATYVQLVKSGVIGITDDSWDEYIHSFQSSDTAGVINGCWIMASIQAQKEQEGLWKITNMPRLENVNDATNYSNNGGASWVVTKNCKNVELATDFLHKTFAGSVAFYSDILPATGAIATWSPAADAKAYDKPSAFFSNEKVFQKIMGYASKVPSNNTGVYYYEARDAIGLAVTHIVNGSDMEKELQIAQDTVQSYMP